MVSVLIGLLAAAPLPPYLRYALSEGPGGTCQTKAVEWVDGNEEVLWSRPPPITTGPDLPCDRGEVQNYRQAPRHQKLPGYSHLEAAGAVWIFTGERLQGIDIQSGRLLFETQLSPTNPLKQPSFFFDEGSFAYGPCRGKTPRGPVFTVCGQELVVFNGLTALVIDLPARREKARNQFSKGKQRFGGRAAQVSARIPLGEQTLELVGLIFMR
jgi:hypothetical protein